MAISLKPAKRFWPAPSFLVLGTLLLAGTGALADSPPPKDSQDAILDLGKVGRGWTGDLTWKLTNPSTQTMIVLAVEPGCHCVEPKIDHLTLEPGQSTRVHARIRTLSQPEGPVTWKVKVRHRVGNETGETSFWAKADLIADIVCQPTIVAFRGNGSATVPLVLSDRRKPGLEVLKVASGVQGIQAHLVKGQPGENQIRIEKLPGNHGTKRGFLVLETNDPVYTSIEVPVHIEPATSQKVEATPAEVRLNPPGAARVVLSRPGDLLVRVARVNTPAGLSAKTHKGPGAKATLEFHQTGVLAAGEKVLVEFENSQLPTLELPVELLPKLP